MKRASLGTTCVNKLIPPVSPGIFSVPAAFRTAATPSSRGTSQDAREKNKTRTLLAWGKGSRVSCPHSPARYMAALTATPLCQLPSAVLQQCSSLTHHTLRSSISWWKCHPTAKLWRIQIHRGVQVLLLETPIPPTS